jgi:hypothetical protein
VQQNGRQVEEQIVEARYEDQIESVAGGDVLVRLRRYEAYSGRDELGTLDGVALRITRLGPKLYQFERLDGQPLAEPLQAVLIQEFEHERGLARHEFLPQEPTEVGGSWSLGLRDTHMGRQFTEMGLELDEAGSTAQGTLLSNQGGQLGLALTFSVKPVSLHGIPFDTGALMVAATTLWVPVDGSGPISRLEESGHFECQIQGAPVRMEVTKVVEVEFARSTE